MLILDFYGQDKTADSGWRKYFKVDPRPVGPADAGYVATIVAAREYRLNLTPLVITPDGALLASPTVQVAHYNGAVRPVGMDNGRGVLTSGGLAELFTTNEAGTNGLQLGGGSKVLDGQEPPDQIWITGTYKGKDIKSDLCRTGLYSSDVVLSPVYMLMPVNSAETPSTPTNPTAPPASGNGLTRAQIADALTNLAVQVRSLP